ncbi:MAG: hypothetical protein RML36_12405 [Anaerolineae bacterium]|nr:hypothetical protein [Anaerolineae bacterium]MDW8100273.1 hypothetical protein [Anaerolineae bacterium]
MRGELFLPKDTKPAAVLECQFTEYRRPGDRDHSVRVLYTCQERLRKGLELYRDVPLRLRLEDGRELSVLMQYEAITPDGRIVGVLRVLDGVIK